MYWKSCCEIYLITSKSNVAIHISLYIFNSRLILPVLKKIWLLFGKNSTALNRSHFKNHRKAEKHVKRTTVKFDFFIITQNPVSVSLLLITYRKYSEFIQKNGWMLQCFSKMAQPFSIHGWIDNFWLLLLCSHGKKSWRKLCGLMWHWWNHLLLQSFHL